MGYSIPHAILVANRDIVCDEELTFSYGEGVYGITYSFAKKNEIFVILDD